MTSAGPQAEAMGWHLRGQGCKHHGGTHTQKRRENMLSARTSKKKFRALIASLRALGQNYMLISNLFPFS